MITDGVTVHGSSVTLPSRVIAPLSINASLPACSSMILCGTWRRLRSTHGRCHHDPPTVRLFHPIFMRFRSTFWAHFRGSDFFSGFVGHSEHVWRSFSPIDGTFGLIFGCVFKPLWLWLQMRAGRAGAAVRCFVSAASSITRVTHMLNSRSTGSREAAAAAQWCATNDKLPMGMVFHPIFNRAPVLFSLGSQSVLTCVCTWRAYIYVCLFACRACGRRCARSLQVRK